MTDIMREWTQRCSSCGEYWRDAHVCAHALDGRLKLPAINPNAKTVQEMADKPAALRAEIAALRARLALHDPCNGRMTGEPPRYTPECVVLRAELAQAMKERSRAIAVGDDMEQEVERLTAERDAAFAMSRCECATDEACANLAKLHAEVAGLREDAERYRWLREKCPWTVCVDGDDGRTATVSLHIKVSKDLMAADGEDDFDAAIDAARKGTTPTTRPPSPSPQS